MTAGVAWGPLPPWHALSALPPDPPMPPFLLADVVPPSSSPGISSYLVIAGIVVVVVFLALRGRRGRNG